MVTSCYIPLIVCTAAPDSNMGTHIMCNDALPHILYCTNMDHVNFNLRCVPDASDTSLPSCINCSNNTRCCPPVKMNRQSKYFRREIYSLGTVKRSTDFKHQKSIISEETRRIWQGLNQKHTSHSQGECSNHWTVAQKQ